MNNPLTLIAVFAGLAEVVATLALPRLDGTVQAVFVWFVMLLPALLVVLFFLTLNLSHRVLYPPSDFRHDEAFFRTIRTKDDYHVEEVQRRGSPRAIPL